MWALTLVPEEKVVKVYEEFIVPNIPEIPEEHVVDDDLHEAISFNTKMMQFMEYFERVWFGAKNTRRPDQPRKKPMYRIEHWNKYTHVLAEANLTNNKCESWNSVSKAGLNIHPNIRVVLEKLRKEESLARSKLLNISPTANKPDHRRLMEGRNKRALKLKSIVEKFNSLPSHDYMVMVGAHFNYGV